MKIIGVRREQAHMKRYKAKNVKYGITILLAMVMSIVPITKELGFKGIQDVNAQTTLSNPKRDMSGNVTWDCIWFGSYPQREVMNPTKSIMSAVYDSNGDAIVNGAKYRRIKESDAIYSSKEEGHYNWKTSEYHYFKYEPIKWRVLSKNGNDVFLLADIGLDNQRYHNTTTTVTWENCILRTFLNNEFLNSAFSLSEQKEIINSTVKNKNNPYYGTRGGNNTVDKVYLLSLDEVMNFEYGFNTDENEFDEARCTKLSDYAYAMGALKSTEMDGYCYWWLRSPGNNFYGDDVYGVASSDNTSYASTLVGYCGEVDYEGHLVDNYENAVRPALHFNLSASNLYTYAGTVCSDGSQNEQKPAGIIDDSFPNDANKNEQGTAKVKKKQIISAESKVVTYKSRAFNLKAKSDGDGKLTYVSSNKKVATVDNNGEVKVKRYGKSVITINASETNTYHKTSKQITIKVVPRKVVLKRVFSSKKKRLFVTWKKDNTVSGYQIYFSSGKSFRHTYQRTFRKSKSKMHIANLKSGMTYYVKARSYKKVGKERYYGAWSKVKSIKMK